jgi:hypothetical protein
MTDKLSDIKHHLDGALASLEDASSISFYAMKGILTEARYALDAQDAAIDRLEMELLKQHEEIERLITIVKYIDDNFNESVDRHIKDTVRIAQLEEGIRKALEYTGDNARSHLRDALAKLDKAND